MSAAEREIRLTLERGGQVYGWGNGTRCGVRCVPRVNGYRLDSHA